MGQEADNTIRLDKWLWFARVVKSRTLAQKLVRSAKIRVNRQKFSNPAKSVVVEDVLTITLERQIRILKIKACGERRGPFSEAQELYEDLSPAPSADDTNRPKRDWRMNENAPRPNKQNRRKIMQLKNRQYFQ